MSINIEDKSLLDEMGPEKIVIFRDPSVGMNAILAIDNTAIGWPAGGIRMAPDVSIDEIVRLARAMTYKFASYRLKVGGAKVAKDAEEIFNHVKSEIETKTVEIIKGAQASNISFYKYAADDAFKFIKKYLDRRTKRIKKLNEKY